MDNNNFNQQGYGQQFQNIEPTQPVFPQQSAQTGMNRQYGQPALQNMGQQYSQSAQTGANQQYGQPAQQNMNQQYGQPVQQNMNQQYAQSAQQNMNQQYAQPAQQNMNQQYGQPAQQNTRQQYEQPQNNFNNYSNGNNGGDNGGKKTGLIIGIIIAAIVIIGGIVATVLLLNKNKADDKDKNSGKETTTAEVTTTEATTTEMTTTEATTTEMTTTEATTTEAATTESLNPDQIPEGTKYYILSDMTENGQESGEFAEELKMLEGYKVAYLLFYPDGTGYIYVYSTFDDEFTYDATSVTITGEKVNMTSDGNNVYLDDGYYTIVLKEITKAEFDSLQDLPEDLGEY